MNIKRAKEEIKNTIRAYLARNSYGEYEIPVMGQRPVLLMGPPGIGKTQIMEQVARECGIGLVAYTITHHTRQSAIGLPFISEQTYGEKAVSVTQYTMSEIVAAIYNKMEETGLKEGILFIDEINCVSETLAPTMLQFLQCKTFGNHKIPEGWLIAAAGNPPEYNKSVREFDIVTLDRLKLIQVEPDFGVWKEYAVKESIHPAIISYLSVKEQNFCRIETTVDGKFFATPRGWEDLSRLIEVYEQLHLPVDRDVIVQYIQFPAIAKDFANYLELYYKYENDYQVDAILRGEIREELCEKVSRAPFDEKLSVISLLLTRLGTAFRTVTEEEQRLEMLMEYLKIYREQEGDGPARLNDILAAVSAQWEEKKREELLSRADDRRYRKVIGELENWCRTLRSRDLKDPEETWAAVKKLFAGVRDQYEQSWDEAGEMLEHGFDFMEAAFGDSQEMVVFVTNLNTSYYCVRFLQEYECQRYYQYNKKLLFEDREGELKKRISAYLD